MTAQELAERSAAMPAEWVEYPGSTPPLRLHVRGQSYETYRGFVSKHLNVIGEAAFEAMSPQMLMGFNCLVMADAYVTEWEGATYPNGAPMPYAPEYLAPRMESDPDLMTFLSLSARKLSPAYPHEQG
jgi:hypothetical protein